MRKLLMPFAFFSALAQAQIYETIDKDGSTRFSDSKAQNAQEIQLNKTNTVPALKLPEASPIPLPSSSPEPSPAPLWAQIDSPSNGSQIGPKENSIQFEFSSNLSADDYSHIVLLMDGEEIRTFNKQQAVFIDLSLRFRGKHDFQLQFYNAQHLLVSSSEPISLNILRPKAAPRPMPRN